MSYTPTEWKAGDTVTSAKLNKIEQGVASSSGVLVVNDVDGTLDKTWAELFAAEVPIVVHATTLTTSMWELVINVGNADGDYYVTTLNLVNGYHAESESGYPAYEGGNLHESR